MCKSESDGVDVWVGRYANQSDGVDVWVDRYANQSDGVDVWVGVQICDGVGV